MKEKPHFVLLPGFMLDDRLWQSVLPILSEMGQIHHFTISDETTIEALAKKVLAQAPEKFVLFGFSMGGMVAQQMATIAPYRLQGLVLINTTSRSPTESEIKRYQGQITLATQLPFKGLTKRAIQSALAPQHQHEEDLVACIQTMAVVQGKKTLLNQLEAMKNRQAIDLAKIDCPTCVISSDNDQLFPSEISAEMARCIKNADYYQIPDSGHMTPLEQPTILAHTIRQWLKIQQLVP